MTDPNDTSWIKLQKLHFEIQVIKSLISYAEKKLENVKHQAQQLGCAILDKIDK